MTSVPPDESIIFHYLAFPELLAVLQNKKMWFTRLGEFRKDPQEGCIALPPNANERAVNAAALVEPVMKLKCASCWTLDEGLSDLMWLGYRPHFGVAIESTVGNLKRSFPNVSNPHLLSFSPMHYGSPQTGGFQLVAKRARYSRDKEYRVMYSEPGLRDHKGIAVPVDLDTLIIGIWVSPHGCGSWFAEVVRREIEIYLPNVRVAQDSFD